LRKYDVFEGNVLIADHNTLEIVKVNQHSPGPPPEHVVDPNLIDVDAD
jgi:hypothetical protein